MEPGSASKSGTLQRTITSLHRIAEMKERRKGAVETL